MRTACDWEKVNFGDCLELIRNGYSGTQVNEITDYPVSRIETISDGTIDLDKTGYVEMIPHSYLLNEGDILFSNINSLKHIGKIAYVNEGIKLYHGMNLLVIRPSKQMNSKFLFYLLVEAKQWFEKMAAQAVNQASINQSELKKLQLYLPRCKNEQSKIVEILERIDFSVEQTEALIAKQLRIKTGLMQELLTKGIDEYGNIRSEDTHEFKNSPLGRIPVEWEVPRIDDLATRVGSGITPKGGESVYQKDGILFIRSQNVHFRGLKLNDVAYISEEIHRAMKRSEVFENDVLLNITGASIGRCCYVPVLDYKANVNQHVCTIRLREANCCDAGYLSFVIESSIGQNQILQFNAGGNREGLNYQQVRSFQIPWAKDEERFRIFTIINSLNETIETLNRELEKQYRLKTGLMQDLLPGKKRVTPLLRETEVKS